jgi:uncharacterized protein
MSEAIERFPTPTNGSQNAFDPTGVKPPASPAPTTLSERFNSIDVLRGFALLGILPINILAFALPWTAYLNPTVAGGFTGTNFVTWIVCYVLFDHKMMTIFSMLFGAGLVLMSDRMEQRGASAAAFFYRRAIILFAIGLAHAYLLWQGDILVSYALCGMVVYPLRKLPPKMLVVLGLLVMLPSVWLARGESVFYVNARDAALRVQKAVQNSETPSDADLLLAKKWEGIRRTFQPTVAEIDENIQGYRNGSYLGLARSRVSSAFAVETEMFGRNLIWTVSGRMLIGIALMKLGVFSAERSLRFYLTVTILGYGLGLPVVGLGAYRLIENDFDVVYLFGGGAEFNDFGSMLVALGHLGTVVSIFKAGLATWLTSGLAAVGRMALSNYLMQSLICTTLFYGYGLALFGALDRIQLLGVVVAIWLLQLSYSPFWLRFFRFGPVEWLWRSLTYGKSQPMWNSWG